MLTYETLVRAAEARGMPSSKMRGILREYLQILILNELYRTPSGKKYCFTGGTYLRLVHGLQRFSEDLDFNAARLSEGEFEKTMAQIQRSLKKQGLSVRLEFGHWQNLYVAEMIFPEVEKFYHVISKYSKKEGIVIKVEVNRPRWKIYPETLVIAGFGQMMPVICTQKGALVADKIDALLKKNRARHLFDLIFMLSQKYPVDFNVLKILGIKGPPFKAIIQRVEGFSPAELKTQAEALRPFLFDESQADLIINAKSIFRNLPIQ